MTLDDKIKCYRFTENLDYEELECSRDTLWYYQVVGSIKVGCAQCNFPLPEVVLFDECKVHSETIELYCPSVGNDIEDIKKYRLARNEMEHYFEDNAELNSSEEFKIIFKIM